MVAADEEWRVVGGSSLHKSVEETDNHQSEIKKQSVCVSVCVNEFPSFDILHDMMLYLSSMTKAINGVH